MRDVFKEGVYTPHRRHLTPQNIAAAASTAYGAYQTYRNVGDVYKYLTGNQTASQAGFNKIKEDTYGLIDLEKIIESRKDKSKNKNIVVKHKMPLKSSYSKKQFKKSKKTFKKSTPKKSTLSKEVKQLKKAVQSDQAYHTNKVAGSSYITSAVGGCNNTIYGGMATTQMESAMANLRYYDPATPSTLVTANASTGTFARVIHFKSITGSLNVRNNYQTACRVRVYLCTPKADTSIDPTSYYSAGVADQVISGDVTSPMLYLTDIDMVNKAWNIKCLKNKILHAGSEVTVSHTVKDIDYDPSLVDTHSLTWQKKYKNFTFCIRVEGLLAHDTAVSGQQGLMASQVDLQYTNVFKMIYDAGTNLNDISYTDGRDTTFTNGAVISQQPVVDNQALSVA